MLRFVKILHTLGAIGLMGGLAGFVLLSARAQPTAQAALAVRASLEGLFVWGLVPSMLLCVLSGFLSMGLHRPFRDALWAGLKGVSGLSVLELTLHLQSQAREATALAAEALGGHAEPLAWEGLRHTEVVLGWVLLLLTLLNIVLGVWRPRFRFIHGLPQARPD
jgi:hypothetical protein